MDQTTTEKELLDGAIAGDRAALDNLLGGVRDLIFNLSLRMLGSVPDAEDATQEILVKILTHLSSFRQECKFSTWAYRIAINHLKNYAKGMFAAHPLSFEVYGEDIASGRERDVPDQTGGVERAALERELKFSCSNVMLQCFDPQTRVVYILGTMFRLDSRVAAEILEITPEAYRQRLSRCRKKMAEFLGEYCGLSGSGRCACARRVDYAVATHRLDPKKLGFQSLTSCSYAQISDCTDAMERLDDLSMIFAEMPAYRSPQTLAAKMRKLLASPGLDAVLNAEASL